MYQAQNYILNSDQLYICDVNVNGQKEGVLGYFPSRRIYPLFPYYSIYLFSISGSRSGLSRLPSDHFYCFSFQLNCHMQYLCNSPMISFVIFSPLFPPTLHPLFLLELFFFWLFPLRSKNTLYKIMFLERERKKIGLNLILMQVVNKIFRSNFLL